MSAEAHDSLALRYRPFQFEGPHAPKAQPHIMPALKAAVRTNRIANAYLFCGPKGTGKTTSARVLASALNCPNRADDGEPCGECPSCQKIRRGSESLDVVEIDAASNRGVDDARELRERAMYAPAEGRFKIYIIDEAHMLTREAWNALLKILEEPPPRVVFVFATTEVEKIQDAAPPVLSRCQRYDFHAISVDDTIEHLKCVAADEEIAIDPDALIFIARKATGAMRDALSLLEQVVTFASPGVPVTAKVVREAFGLLEETYYTTALRQIAAQNTKSPFRLIQLLRAAGGRYEEFYRSFWRTLHETLGVLSGTEPEGWSPNGANDLKKIAAEFTAPEILAYLRIMQDGEPAMRNTHEPDLVLTSLLMACVEARLTARVPQHAF